MKTKRITIQDHLKNPTPESHDAMVEQGARAIAAQPCDRNARSEKWWKVFKKYYPTLWSESVNQQIAALASIGITRPVTAPATRRRGKQ